MDPRTPEDITGYLLEMERPPDEQDNHRLWVEANAHRFLRTLSLVPQGEPGQRCLEIGSMPYTFTLLMKKFRPYALTLVDYYPGTGSDHRETVRLPALNERHDFVSHRCDIERDELPFQAHTFDGVLCCEVLEHLTTDPVAMLAEIHRLLKPDGWLILTTPQVANLRNILDLLHGRNIYGRYELVFGTTWRHNREYTRREVVDLLETTGFRAESAAVEDAHPALGSASLARRLLLRLLRRLYGQEYGDQLYVRARPQRQFHWTYPRWLFEHADLHVVARYDYVRVGENDALQLGLGWGACEPDGHTGELVRTVTGEHADALIKTNPGATRLAFELHRRSPHPQSLRLQVSPHPSGAAAADQHVDVTLQHDHETILVDVPHTATAAALRIHIRTSPGSVALRSLRWVE